MLIRTRESTCRVLSSVVLFEIVCVTLWLSPSPCTGLHVYGRWDPDEEFFLFVSKFGFQKTELANKNDTQGFIFGNVTIVSLPPTAGGRIASIPSIPPAALIPKVRVPREAAVLPQQQNSSSSVVRGSNITQYKVEVTSATPPPVKTTPFVNNSSNATPNPVSHFNKSISPSGVPSTSSQAPPSHGIVAETFVNPSKPPPAPIHINFSSVKLPSSSKPRLLEVSSSSPLPVSSEKSSSVTPSPSTSSTSTASSLSSSSTPGAVHNNPNKPTSSSKPINAISKSSTTSTTTTTTSSPVPPTPPKIYPATLVVLDRGLFIDFYKNRLIKDKDKACKRMFDRIAHVAYDPICYPEGTENLYKRMPCPKDGICPDDVPTNRSIVERKQFTYAISDLSKAKFWYVSLVPCYRHPKTCEWEYSKNNSIVDYDIWLVNGNPYTKNQNPLEYQFSFDRQDTVEIYLVFFLCYLILVPLQIHAVLRQRHIVPKLFTASVALELTAVTSNVIHVLKFALNGEGHPGLAVFGDVMDIIARAIFMLILLVLAKGWAVTRTELTSKPFIFSIWAMYGVVHILLYVWKETEVDVIEDIDEYQTWPGWLILILRTIIMIWFLYELKDTMDHEHQPHKLNFFLHFGAAALVWFIYLPIVALIALQVSPLWRSKFLLGITYSADCLAFAIMTHLLWPTRTEQYFLLMSKDAILTDELEEFNEAPHVVNSYVRRPNHWYPVNYSFHDVSSPEAVSLTQGNTLQNLNHQYPHQRFSTGSNGFTTDDVKDNVPLIIT